jgi:Flp pilus assembly protein TadD
MNKGMDERLDQAVALLNQGRLQEGKDALERLDADNPKQAPILYNLGMCYTELGFPDKAIAALGKCVSLQPEFANAWVALGVARAKKGDQAGAKQALEKALVLDADNPYALRNLAAVLGNAGDYQGAVESLLRARGKNPTDPLTLYGLALSYHEIGERENADRYLKELIDMGGPDQVLELAKSLRRTLAGEAFRSLGFRMDAVFYCYDALQKYAKLSPDDVREIAFEIADNRDRARLPEDMYNMTSSGQNCRLINGWAG